MSSLSTIYSVGTIVDISASDTTRVDAPSQGSGSTGDEEADLAFLDNLRALKQDAVTEGTSRYASGFAKQMTRLMKRVSGQITPKQQQELDDIKFQHLKQVQELLARRLDIAVENDDFIQEDLNKIFESSGNLSEETDFLMELKPKAEEAGKKVAAIKESADESYTSLSKEIEKEVDGLKADESANRTVRKSIFKTLDHTTRIAVKKDILQE